MIRLGSLVNAAESPVERMGFLRERGFESFSLSFWQDARGLDLEALADRIAALGIHLSAVSVYGNVLGGDDAARACAATLDELIRLAPRFGTDLVTGFAGRIPGKAVDACIDAWKAFFEPRLEKASLSGLRLAFENCRMGGTWKSGSWNIAINPDAWDLMRSALPSDNWGIEWEPGHSLLALSDPLAQLSACVDRVFHVHGKDASLNRPLIASQGFTGAKPFGVYRFPGFGDSDWTAIMAMLEKAAYQGTVDIEGGLDPVYRDAREDEGQNLALAFLRSCRMTASTSG